MAKEVPFDPTKTVVTLQIKGRVSLEDLAALLGDAEEHVTQVQHCPAGYGW
jgi:hypothetical protein